MKFQDTELFPLSRSLTDEMIGTRLTRMIVMGPEPLKPFG